MRNFKKVIAGALALLMLALSVNVTFAAEEYNDAEAVAVAKVNAAGIMQGTDKGFEPSKTLTRAEAAAIMVRMKGISESTVKQSAGTTLFTDVAASHWAAGYINVASNYGIIVGVGANKFAPEKEVSVAEFYTMAVRALGAGKLVDSEGTWPTNYVNFAIENNLAEDVAQIYTATATRITAAIIAANTIEADVWEKSAVKSNGEITWEAKAGKTIVEDVLKFSAFSDKAKKITNEIKVASVSNTKKTVNSKDAVKDLDLSNIKVGMTYQVWYNKDGEIAGLWINKDSDKVEFTQIVKMDIDKNEITLLVNGSEKKYDLDETKLNDGTTTAINVLYNEEATGAPAKVTKNKNASGVAYIDDNAIKSLYITEFIKYASVKEVANDKVKFETSKVKGGNYTTAIALGKDDVEYFLTKDGKSFDFADLEKGDAIKFYVVPSSGTITKYVGEVITDVVEGKIASKNSTDKYVKIDGAKLSYVDAVASELNADDEVRVWKNAEGKIIMVEKIEAAASDVAIVTYYKDVTTDRSGATGLHNVDLRVKLTTLDGAETEVLALDCEETYNEFADQVSTDDIKEVASIAAATAANTYTINGVGNAANATALTGKYYQTAPNTYFTTKEEAGYALALANIALGKVACYRTSGNEVVIKPAKVAVNDKEFNTMSGIYAASTSKLALDDAVKGISTVYLNEDTTIIRLKADSDTKVKVEMIKYEDLDNSTFGAGSYVIDLNKDEKECKAIVISTDAASSVKREKTNNFALITNVSEGNKVKTVNVVYLNGDTDELEAYSDDLSSYSALTVGAFLDLSVSDGKIVDIDLTSVSTSAISALDKSAAKDEKTASQSFLATTGSPAVLDTTTKEAAKVTNNLVSKKEITVGTTEYTLADDVLVLSIANDKVVDYLTGKEVSLTTAEAGDIEEYDDGTEEDYVARMYAFQNDDHNVEIKVIVFVNDLK